MGANSSASEGRANSHVTKKEELKLKCMETRARENFLEGLKDLEAHQASKRPRLDPLEEVKEVSAIGADDGPWGKKSTQKYPPPTLRHMVQTRNEFSMNLHLNTCRWLGAGGSGAAGGKRRDTASIL